ncbi:unnamed protein product [Linum trigynum]|uniref:Uncharacterized protein n=1 Tax=Linum trigynum TaxID=586398 RepID=A0AAV2E0S0_9ROSI
MIQPHPTLLPPSSHLLLSPITTAAASSNEPQLRHHLDLDLRFPCFAAGSSVFQLGFLGPFRFPCSTSNIPATVGSSPVLIDEDESSAAACIDGIIRDLIHSSANVSIPQLIQNVREIIYPCNPNLAALLEYRLRSLLDPGPSPIPARGEPALLLPSTRPPPPPPQQRIYHNNSSAAAAAASAKFNVLTSSSGSEIQNQDDDRSGSGSIPEPQATEA